MKTQTRRLGVVALGAAAVLLLSACGSTDSTNNGSNMGNNGNNMGNNNGNNMGTNNGMMTSDMNIDGAMMGDHVHNLAFDGSNLVLGTHQGLYLQAGENKPTKVSNDAFDVMGFAMAGSTWMASGHPGSGMNAPADLGLMMSADAGKTWTNLSLSGTVDFHRLVALGNTILGINSGNGHMMRSGDGGKTWADLGKTSLYDIALAPADASTVIGTSEKGLMRSTDGGKTFTAVKGAPTLALLSVTGMKMFGADVYGTVFESTDAGLTWMEIGKLAGQPSAFAVSGKRIAALVDTTVYLSTDAGKTFTKHLVNIGGM